MKSTNVIVLASLVVIGGKWAKGGTVVRRMVVGGIMLAIIITVVADANEGLADKFAWLILAGALGSNAENLFNALAKVTGTDSANPTVATAATSDHVTQLHQGAR